MSNSHLTEKSLAESFKKLMLKYPVNKITVKQVTDESGVTRRTFYNHFIDIYELLEWIYEHEVIEELEGYNNLNGWKEAINLVLQYTLNNRKICLNVFNSLGRDHLEKFLYNIFYNEVKGVVNDITNDLCIEEDITNNLCIEEDIKNEIIGFYTLAIVGEFIMWLRNDLKEGPEKILSRIERMMNGTLSFVFNRNSKAKIK